MHSKHEPQNKLKKDLSIPGMLRVLRSTFEQTIKTEMALRSPKKESPEEAERRRERYLTISDYLMASQAMFFLKCATLLDFDKKRRDPVVVQNMKSLFGVERIPSDTSMRERLDPVPVTVVEAGFEALFEIAQRNGVIRHMREQTVGGTAYVAVDATRYFSSPHVQCAHCCECKKDGKVTYSHGLLGAVIVHPYESQVIPLRPEQIQKQDGVEKNDCEQNAFKRWIAKYCAAHPRLPTTFLLDGLYAVTPVVEAIQAEGSFFVITLKDDVKRHIIQEKMQLPPSGKLCVEAWPNKLHTTKPLNEPFERASDLVGEESRFNGRPVPKQHGLECITIRWWKSMPLTAEATAPVVTVVEATVQPIVWPMAKAGQPRPEPRLGKPSKFQYITNHEVTAENALDLVRAGRSRWKIENETFNALKNCGYELEHNYGHGQRNLASIFATQILLSFAVEGLVALID